MSSTSQLVSSLNSEVSAFENNVATAVNKVDTTTQEIRSNTERIYNRITAFKKTMLEGEEKSIAQENILKIEQKINEQLSSYLTIRRSVIGIVKDMDFNLVRNVTIAELSEQLWMSSSRYWLSYAMIALNAWIQNDKEVATNAVSETMRKDRVKGSLFFCLLSLRFGRNDAAKKWIYEYFNSVDPVNPPKESALLLQAYLFGVFGNDTIIENAVKETVDGWMREIQQNADISNGVGAAYYNYISTLPSKVTVNYQTLAAHCSNYQELERSLSSVQRFKLLFNQISDLDAEEALEVNRDFINRIDSVLDDLISNYDDEELKLINEKRYYELIIENDGDVEKARQQFQAVGANNGKLVDIGNQMVAWATAPRSNKMVKRFAMQKTKNWYEGAVTSYEAAISTERPSTYALKIDLWSDVVDGKDREGVKKNLEDTFNAKKIGLTVLNKGTVVLGIFGVITLIAALLIGILATPFGFIGLAIPVVFFLVIVLKCAVASKKFPKRIAAAVTVLYKCFDEIEHFNAQYQALASEKSALLEKIHLL